MAILALFAILVTITFGALSSSKTATGVISFVLPPTSGVATMNLYYDATVPQMYLGEDASGTPLSATTKKCGKLVLTNTQSANAAYIKFEIKILGNESLSYSANATTPTFSDGTTLTHSSSNGVLTLTSSAAVSQYSHIFIDSILSNLQTAEVMSDATLQIKAIVSLSSDFSSSSSSSIYYNLTTPKIVTISIERHVVSTKSGTEVYADNEIITIKADYRIYYKVDSNNPVFYLESGEEIYNQWADATMKSCYLNGAVMNENEKYLITANSTIIINYTSRALWS